MIFYSAIYRLFMQALRDRYLSAHSTSYTAKGSTLSVLLPLAAIVLGHFSGNFTWVLIDAVKNSKGL
jgi:hypothetical protein